MSVAAASAIVAAAAAGTMPINTISGFTYDIDPSATFAGLPSDQYQFPHALPPAPAAPKPAAPAASAATTRSPAASTTSSGTSGGGAGTGRPSVVANLLSEVLQSGGKFDPRQFDFSVLTLPNTHKASRKKKAGAAEGGDKAAAATAGGNKSSSIL